MLVFRGDPRDPLICGLLLGDSGTQVTHLHVILRRVRQRVDAGFGRRFGLGSGARRHLAAAEGRTATPTETHGEAGSAAAFQELPMKCR